MKRSIITMALLAVSFTATASPVYEGQALISKVEIGRSLVNIASLTDSLSPRAKANTQMAGINMGNLFTQQMDKLVISGLQQGASCEMITAQAITNTSDFLNKIYSRAPHSTMLTKNGDNLQENVGVYTLATCKNLSGE